MTVAVDRRDADACSVDADVQNGDVIADEVEGICKVHLRGGTRRIDEKYNVCLAVTRCKQKR